MPQSKNFCLIWHYNASNNLIKNILILIFLAESSDNGITQTSDRFRLKKAPSEASNKLFQDLNSTGIASMDILHEEDRISLAEVAKCLPFRDVDAYAGPYQVEQDFKFFDKDHVLDNGHPFMVLKRHYEAWINELFLTRNQYAFQTPFSINEITVNKYHPQSRGIGAHRDHARYLNLVSIFVLEGYAELEFVFKLT
jgi:hypothetical protein